MLQLSHLCTNQRIVKRRAQLITQAEAMCIDPKHAVEELAKLQIVMTTHYIKLNEWDKAQALVKTLCTMGHDLFTYELLDAIAMEENMQVVGESIPLYLLGNYLMLRVLEGKNNRTILQRAAMQLVEKIEKSSCSGVKINEILQFCRKFVGLAHRKD